jgi:hypothetical protein
MPWGSERALLTGRSLETTRCYTLSETKSNMRTDGQRGDQAIEGDASGACQGVQGLSRCSACARASSFLRRIWSQHALLNSPASSRRAWSNVGAFHAIRVALRHEVKREADSAMERMAAQATRRTLRWSWPGGRRCARGRRGAWGIGRATERATTAVHAHVVGAG